MAECNDAPVRCPRAGMAGGRHQKLLAVAIGLELRCLAARVPSYPLRGSGGRADIARPCASRVRARVSFHRPQTADGGRCSGSAGRLLPPGDLLPWNVVQGGNDVRIFSRVEHDQLARLEDMRRRDPQDHRSADRAPICGDRSGCGLGLSLRREFKYLDSLAIHPGQLGLRPKERLADGPEGVPSLRLWPAEQRSDGRRMRPRRQVRWPA
jgi:hypothetical protein